MTEQKQDLDGYQIVIPNGATESVEGLSAYELKATLANLGCSLTVVEDDGSASVSQKSILVGKTAATVGEMPTGNQYSICEDANGCIQIAAGSYYGYRAALDYIQKKGGIPVGVNRTGAASVSAVEQKPNGAIRVMFYNLSGHEDTVGISGGPLALRQELQCEIFKSYAPDVICFQEYTAASHQALTSKLTALGYKEVPLNWLLSITGTVNYTPIFYKESAVKLIDHGYHSYTGGEDYNDSNSKSLSWAVFEENKADGEQFAVVGTHLMWNANNTDHTAQRQANVAELLEQIGTIKDEYADIPIIVGGDLNCYPDSAPLNDIENGGFTWMREAQGVNTDTLGYKGYSTYSYTDHVYTAVPTPHATNGGIDHAFYSGNVTVINYLTLTDRNSCLASDHQPKLADIILG